MLKTLDITNFTCFPKAKLEFSPGLNVIVGENGTGKSHLLKLGYAGLYVASQVTQTDGQEEKNVLLRKNLNGIFKSSSINKLFSSKNNNDMNCLVNIAAEHANVSFKFNFDTQILSNNFDSFDKVDVVVNGNALSPVFIPAKEVLSIYGGLAYEIENRKLDFDHTYMHVAKMLEARELMGVELEKVNQYAVSVEKITNSICVKVNDKFILIPFLIEKNRENRTQITEYPSIEAHLAAEGHRKIGMLSYLLRNGTLQPKTSLFWDEPEANLNPKLTKKLAEILLELASIMQITIATHSLFLVRELEIFQEKKQLKGARYFGLHFNEGGNGVNVTQGDSPNHIGDIVALDEEIAQSSRYLSMGE